MPNYTPGPWKCRPYLTPNEDEDPILVYQVEAGDLADRYQNLDADYDCEEAEDSYSQSVALIHAENEANARLIAAAPQLVEALEKIYSNAAESPEWIRRVINNALALVEGK